MVTVWCYETHTPNKPLCIYMPKRDWRFIFALIFRWVGMIKLWLQLLRNLFKWAFQQISMIFFHVDFFLFMDKHDNNNIIINHYYIKILKQFFKAILPWRSADEIKKWSENAVTWREGGEKVHYEILHHHHKSYNQTAKCIYILYFVFIFYFLYITRL